MTKFAEVHLDKAEVAAIFATSRGRRHFQAGQNTRFQQLWMRIDATSATCISAAGSQWSAAFRLVLSPSRPMVSFLGRQVISARGGVVEILARISDGSHGNSSSGGFPIFPRPGTHDACWCWSRCLGVWILTSTGIPPDGKRIGQPTN